MDRLRMVARLRRQLHEQQQWISDCENNGVSYAGPDGDAIREADAKAAQALEYRIGVLTGRFST